MISKFQIIYLPEKLKKKNLFDVHRLKMINYLSN